MTTQRRTTRLFAVLLVLLAGFAAWSYLTYRASRHAAEVAANNEKICEGLVDEINALRVKPSLATLQAQSDTELSTRIEELAMGAFLPAQSILSIQPRQPQRLPDTSYLEQATVVDLTGVSLRQLVTFLVRLLQEEAELRLTNLRLSAPRRESTTTANEVWGVEVTLTYLIFSPT